MATEQVKAPVDWRKEPPGYAFEMTQADGIEPTIFVASDDYNRDRARMANAMDLDYIEVRMETVYYCWAAEEAEEQFRLEHRCTCEHADGLPCKTVAECSTAEPAESLSDFWDEDGRYCPWSECKASDPGAVKFRRGADHA